MCKNDQSHLQHCSKKCLDEAFLLQKYLFPELFFDWKGRDMIIVNSKAAGEMIIFLPTTGKIYPSATYHLMQFANCQIQI